VWIGAIAGVLGILAEHFSSNGVFALLQNSVGSLVVFVYIITAAAHIRLRRERERTGAPPPALQMWLFPWASYAAIAGMFAVLIAMAVTPGLQRDFYISLITLVVAIVAYALIRVRRNALAASQAVSAP